MAPSEGTFGGGGGGKFRALLEPDLVDIEEEVEDDVKVEGEGDGGVTAIVLESCPVSFIIPFAFSALPGVVELRTELKFVSVVK